MRALRIAAVLACLSLTAVSPAASAATRPEPAAFAVEAAVAPAPVVVVAVGDIACEPNAKPTATACRQAATAALTRKIDPDAVLALGDEQYESGRFYDFRHSYRQSWGSLRAITYPAPGNHEYHTKGAAGYYQYFTTREPGPPGYYAFNLGGWRGYALNSNCANIDCAREYRWLKHDIAGHPRKCSLFTMHHPRYSSGSEHGSDPTMRHFFAIAYNRHVDMVLTGHDHDYERFARMDAAGHKVRDGVIEFVAGTGGKSLYTFGTAVHGSAYRRAGHFGVLRLSLGAGSFSFAFKDVNGSTPDKGHRSCH